jgi:hypothetical protein
LHLRPTLHRNHRTIFILGESDHWLAAARLCMMWKLFLAAHKVVQPGPDGFTWYYALLVYNPFEEHGGRQ